MDNNFKVGDKVLVLLGKEIGTVEKIFPNESYSIQINFGYGAYYTFKPCELEKLKQSEPSA